MTWDAHRMCRSARNVWLTGICGGLGEYTPLPAWMWRALFVATTLGVGAGPVAYIALWLFMPRARRASSPRHDNAAASHG
jgi:phage shock protein PspC (stress-responsive transcriptional regulator)